MPVDHYDIYGGNYSWIYKCSRQKSCLVQMSLLYSKNIKEQHRIHITCRKSKENISKITLIGKDY